MGIRLIETESMDGDEKSAVIKALCKNSIQYYTNDKETLSIVASFHRAPEAIYLKDKKQLLKAKAVLSEFYKSNYRLPEPRIKINPKLKVFLITMLISSLVSVCVLFW